MLVVGLAAVFILRHHEAMKKAEEAEKRKTAPIPVTIAVARKGDIGEYLTTLGTVTPAQNVTVKSRVDGALTAVHFTEGQMVKKDDLLAELDPTPFLAAVKQSEGQLARDQAQLKNARLDLERYRRVFLQHAIPEQQVQTQEALVEQEEGTTKLDEGALDNARAQLAYTFIRSPLTGRAGLRLVDVGNMVHATDAGGILVIAQLQPIDVVFSISEDQIGEVATEYKKGQPMPVDALDRDEHAKLATGKLLTLDNQIDATTGTVKLKAEFANAHDELFPNQFVNAKLLVKTIHDATIVPSGAIQHQGDKSTVFVMGGDQKVANRPVQIVTTDGDNSAVTGVNPDDKIVTDGFEKLQDGSLVEVKTDQDEAAPNDAGNKNPPKDDASKNGKSSDSTAKGKSKGGQ